MRIGFIGAGNMGFAMMKGAIRVFDEEITYTDISTDRLEYAKEELGIAYLETNQGVVDKSDIVVLAVKPQYLPDVLMNIDIDTPKIVVSIAPGITIDHINALMGGNPKIVRAMPNTPALIGEGMSALCFGEMDFSEDEKEEVIRLFESFGKAVVLKEELMDAVVPVSGSSPAYVYMFIEGYGRCGCTSWSEQKDGL